MFKQQYKFKYDSESGKTIKNVRKYGRLGLIEFHFFGMPIKTLGSLGKISVGQVTGNTHISFFGLMKSLHGQVCAKDELPVGKKPLQAKAFIVNTVLAMDPGQHWVALYFTGNKAIYFDSYGLPPLKDHVLPFIQNNSLGWIENTQMLQDVTSEVCGLNCIYVLYE